MSTLSSPIYPTSPEEEEHTDSYEGEFELSFLCHVRAENPGLTVLLCRETLKTLARFSNA